MTEWRRFEVMLPRRFDDGKEVPKELFAEAAHEIAAPFCGVLYRDNLVCIMADVADTAQNQARMKEFKNRWKERLKLNELWMVSYPIDIE